MVDGLFGSVRISLPPPTGAEHHKARYKRSAAGIILRLLQSTPCRDYTRRAANVIRLVSGLVPDPRPRTTTSRSPADAVTGSGAPMDELVSCRHTPDAPMLVAQHRALCARGEGHAPGTCESALQASARRGVNQNQPCHAVGCGVDGAADLCAAEVLPSCRPSRPAKRMLMVCQPQRCSRSST